MNAIKVQRTQAEDALDLDLPTRRVESFHYTDLRSLLRELPEESGSSKEGVDYAPMVDTHLVSIRDGKLTAEQVLPSGVTFSSNAEKANSSDINDAIVSMNAATAGDAIAIEITGKETLEKPLGLGHVSTVDGRTGVYHRVIVKEGAQANIIERHTSAQGIGSLAAIVSELTLEAGTKASWFIVQQENEAATRLARLNVKLGADTDLSIFVLNAGGKLVRQEINVEIQGEGANLAIRGVNLIGENAHIDVTTVLDHQVPNTTATELFRNVVAGDGNGVFQGQIKVAQPAQKTDAQMACNTLLLTDESNFSAKPELEIFADDVVCAHGATVTDIDEGHLFYLRARGIDPKTARGLLIKAFVDEVVEEAEMGEVLEESFVGIIDSWLDENT